MEEDAGKKILIVDDEKAIRDILSDTLVCWGYQVAVASSGIEALNLFLRRSFDLVLTDLNMPGIDGWTLAIHFKDKSPNTPVGLMTAQDKEGVMKKLEGSCVDFALFKPFTLEDIEETVATILDNRALEKGIWLSGINPPCISEKLRRQ